MKPPLPPFSSKNNSSGQMLDNSTSPKEETLTIALNNVVDSEQPTGGEAAERLNTQMSSHAQPKSVEGPAWNPYSGADSNIDIGENRSQRVKLDDLLTKALAPLGYRHVDKLTYRADWSTVEVEHILSIETYGNPKVYLTGDAGLRNNDAESFAIQCQQRYADRNYLRAMRDTGYVRSPWFCPMHFSIGALFGWSVRGSLDTQGFSPETLARALVEPIRGELLTRVRGVTTLQRLLEFIEPDIGPLRWFLCAADYRAALIAYLASKLGIEKAKTKSALLTHSAAMKRGIDTTWLTPDTYIDHILNDADAAIAQKSACG